MKKTLLFSLALIAGTLVSSQAFSVCVGNCGGTSGGYTGGQAGGSTGGSSGDGYGDGHGTGSGGGDQHRPITDGECRSYYGNDSNVINSDSCWSYNHGSWGENHCNGSAAPVGTACTDKGEPYPSLYYGHCYCLTKNITDAYCQLQGGSDCYAPSNCASHAGANQTCQDYSAPYGLCKCVVSNGNSGGTPPTPPTPPTVEEQCTNYNTNCHETCKTPALGCHTETIPNTNVSCQCRGSANSGTSQSTTTTTPEHNVTGNELTAEECAELFPNSIRCSTSVCPAPVSGYTCTEHQVGSRGLCVCLDPINPNVGDDPTIISGGEQPFSQDGYAADGYGYDEITTCPTDMNTQGCCCVPKVSGQAGRFGDALLNEDFYNEAID
ncbi:MAG: hypothetical protein J5787_03490 [Alphaproteobacteria bacterium]|nr:hypothetical protein [Alphaproteobacteria bacterium]